MKNQERILLGHGSGGKLSHNLLSDLFLTYFKNEELAKLKQAEMSQKQKLHRVVKLESKG